MNKTTKKKARKRNVTKKKSNKNNTKYFNKVKSKNKKTKKIKKKVKVLTIKESQSDYKNITNSYNKNKSYKHIEPNRKKININKVNDILDNKVSKLLQLFDNEKVKKLKPQDDFHKVTNISWLNRMKKTDLSEQYFLKNDNFRIGQDKVYYSILQNINDFIINKSKIKGSERLRKSVSNLLESWKSTPADSINKHMIECVVKIDKLRQNDNLWEFLAHLNKNEIISHTIPLHWYMSEDKKNTKLYANYIKSPSVGLYDLNVYFESTPKMKKIKEGYIDYIGSVFETCLGKNVGRKYNPEDVFNVEYKMLLAFSCNNTKNKEKNDENGYNKITKQEALKDYKFNWTEFSKALGYKEAPEWFIVNDINYFKCVIEELIANWKSEEWRTYWVFIHLSQMIRFHKQKKVLHYNFHEKELFGQQAIFPSELYPIFGLSCCFNKLLTDLYRANNYNEEYVAYTQRMAFNLRNIFLARLEKNKWITPKTKKYAIKKIKAIDLIIDSKKELQNDIILPYSKDDPWSNMMMFFDSKIKKQIGLNKKEIVDFSQIDWKNFKLNGTQTYIVNAFYIPSHNRIFIPLAFLQKPFIDLDDRGIEYNLANIGYVLAHEFSHSLDTNGSKYDHNGNLKNWWTAEDKIKYQKLINDVNSQYASFMSNEKLNPDVSLFIGENIADITGVNLCSDYLMLYHSAKHNLESVSTTFLSLKTFYNFYAIQMRQHITDHSLEMLLKTNPHPPDKYRINCPLARLTLFKKIFNIKKNDKMFWQSKIDIW